MNTPSPCCYCAELYVDCMSKDMPGGSYTDCKVNTKPNNQLSCDRFVLDLCKPDMLCPNCNEKGDKVPFGSATKDCTRCGGKGYLRYSEQ